MSATAWSTIASLATAIPDPEHVPELSWLATASRHWNIDRPEPR